MQYIIICQSAGQPLEARRIRKANDTQARNHTTKYCKCGMKVLHLFKQRNMKNEVMFEEISLD